MNTTHRKIKKVKMQDSHKNNLLQLADYIASGTYREVCKPDKGSILDLISHRKISVQIWPKRKPTSIPKESTS